jgi:hypothetical protein
MEMWIGIALVLGCLAWVLSKVFAGGVRGALAHAHRSGDVAPLADAMRQVPEGARPTKWDFVIGSMWRAYRREQAAVLVVAATAQTDADIVQYWIKQVIEVEPEIAQSVFTPQFLSEHFKPEIAQRCGKRGCCG